MPGLRNENRETSPALPQHATDDAERQDSELDPTTLKFNGPVKLSDEDAGGDPYNRTGRFRRVVRG